MKANRQTGMSLYSTLRTLRTMTLFEPESLQPHHAIIAINLHLLPFEKCKKLKIPTTAILHAITIELLQTVIETKDLDHLFRNNVPDDPEFNLTNELTTKIIAMCEEHISEVLESRK